MDSIPMLERCPGGGTCCGSLYSSILAWRITWAEEPGGLPVHRVTESWTCLKWLSTPHAGCTLMCRIEMHRLNVCMYVWPECLLPTGTWQKQYTRWVGRINKRVALEIWFKVWNLNILNLKRKFKNNKWSGENGAKIIWKKWSGKMTFKKWNNLQICKSLNASWNYLNSRIRWKIESFHVEEIKWTITCLNYTINSSAIF